MNLFECLMKNSTCYKGTSKGIPVGILFHDTGAGNPNLKRYVQPYETDSNYDELIKKIGKNAYNNDWNHSTRNAGVNAFIGKLADGTVATAQTLPWEYKPWGCGQGSKGSCNGLSDGRFWIQFEICDDSYSSQDYFNKIYKEACELTAYLCKKFNIDPNGTVEYNGIKVPTILCHADSYKLGLGTNHGDVLKWFKKFGKTMDDVRADVAKLVNPPKTSNAVYRVRKTWADSKSQIGAYSNLDNAKKACDKAGKEYYVFDASGKAIYPTTTSSSTNTSTSTATTTTNTNTTTFKVGDEVKLVSGAKYSSGKTIPDWVFKSKLYVRKVNTNGDIVVSTLKTGAVTGTVNKKYLTKYTTTPSFKEYKVKITASALNVREGAGTSYKVKTTVHKNEVYTIIEEKNGWGKLKSGSGWISLSYTKKV